MRWILALSGNPRNKFSGFKDGKHGTEIFGPHPELPKQMVAWYVDTLVTRPADPKAAVAVKDTPVRKFWRKAVSPDGVGEAVQMFYDVAQRGDRVVLFGEGELNQLGYFHLQAGRPNDAIRLFRLNTIAYAASANTYDSLGDAYLANGQNELALRMSEKALEMLAEGSFERGAQESDSRQRRAEDRQAQRKEVALVRAPPPAGWRLGCGLEVHRPAGDEDVPDPRRVEQVAVGDDDVGHLALLDRAEAIAGAGEPRRIDRQRLQGRILRQPAFLHRPRHAADELRRILQTADGEGEGNARLLERSRHLGGILAHARDAQRRVGVATAAPAAAAPPGPPPTAWKFAETITAAFAALRSSITLRGLGAADDDRIEIELLGEGQRPEDLAFLAGLERDRHLALERRRQRIERRLEAADRCASLLRSAKARASFCHCAS